jgi:drug/metabolite transporter (DMT)-like permease
VTGAAAARHSAAADPAALVVLTGGVLAVSTAATLIRLAQAAPLAIAAYRMTFATVLLAPLAARTVRQDLRRLSLLDRWRIAAAGAFLAAHFALWITSLNLTSVASSVILVSTNPLWVALAAPVVLRQRLGWRLAAGIALAFLGSLVIGSGDLAIGRQILLGDGLAVGGALAAAGYFLIGGHVRPRVSLITYVTLVYGTAAALLAALSVSTGTAMTGYPGRTWVLLLLLAAVPQVLGHSSFNWALRRLSATFVAGAVLGEAVGSMLLAWWVLGEAPPPLAALGGVFVLGGLAVAAGAGEATRQQPPPTLQQLTPG